MSEPTEGHRSKVPLIVVAVVAVLALAAGCGDGGGAGGATSAPPTEAVPSEPAESSSAAGGGEEQAQQVIQQLSDGGISCKWQPGENGDPHTESCEKHEMILAASDNPSAINVWVEHMQEQGFESGAILHAETYAIISPDAGMVNRAWDLLGAEGEVKKL